MRAGAAVVSAMKHSAPHSLRLLLTGSVDYAGLFPPAALPLEAALDNYAAYSRCNDAWMLGRFVLPTGKLVETGPLLAGRFDSTHPLRISVLGSRKFPADERAQAVIHAAKEFQLGKPLEPPADEWVQTMWANSLEHLRFLHAHGEQVVSELFEAHLPLPTDGPTGKLLERAESIVKSPKLYTDAPTPNIYWEVPFHEDLPALVRMVAQRNADYAEFVGAPIIPSGIKLRTGGTEAAAFPSSRQLADALAAIRDAGLAVKFTAGLHHPIRRFDEALGTHMHGFLNVFVAAILGRVHGLDAAEIQDILEDEQPESFYFADESLEWRHRHVSTTLIAAHRQFVTSFGSCSFDEPREDLRCIGLLI